MSYKLLDRFEAVFRDGPYLHRNSTLGDSIALRLYEDLLDINRSKAFTSRVQSGRSVVNAKNTRTGIKARRGDGSFGEIVPNIPALVEPGFNVRRGPIATIEIGVEVKILAKAMIKQIDRVVGDLVKQVEHFKSQGGDAITVAIVGINHASFAVSYEGERLWRTDGRTHKHPIQEAADAERRLLTLAAPRFDEFVILHYRATNEANPTFEFEWRDPANTMLIYGAALTRISQRYERAYSSS